MRKQAKHLKKDSKLPATVRQGSFFKVLCAFIPTKISNAAVLKFFELMRCWQKLFKRKFSENLSINKAALSLHLDSIRQSGGYIEDQHSWSDLKYGKTVLCGTGCELIALYNALRRVGKATEEKFPHIISELEKDGIVLSGKFGTSPVAIADYLQRRGLFAKLTSAATEFDALGRECSAMILTFYNDGRDISKQVHSVCITEENGALFAHNVYCTGEIVGPCATVSDILNSINGGRAKGISLIGIMEK